MLIIIIILLRLSFQFQPTFVTLLGKTMFLSANCSVPLLLHVHVTSPKNVSLNRRWPERNLRSTFEAGTLGRKQAIFALMVLDDPAFPDQWEASEYWPIRSQHYLATTSSSSVQMWMNSEGRERSRASMSATSGVRPSPGASSEIAAWNNLEDWWDSDGKMHKLTWILKVWQLFSCFSNNSNC